MILLANLRVHCFEWNYPVDSSSLPADLQWIGFVLECALWKTLYLVCKMYKTFYNDYNIFPRNALSIKPHWKYSSQIMYESLSNSPSVCFLYNVLALNFRANGNWGPKRNTYELWYYAVSSPTQICICSATFSKFALLKNNKN